MAKTSRSVDWMRPALVLELGVLILCAVLWFAHGDPPPPIVPGAVPAESATAESRPRTEPRVPRKRRHHAKSADSPAAAVEPPGADVFEFRVHDASGTPLEFRIFVYDAEHLLFTDDCDDAGFIDLDRGLMGTRAAIVTMDGRLTEAAIRSTGSGQDVVVPAGSSVKGRLIVDRAPAKRAYSIEVRREPRRAPPNAPLAARTAIEKHVSNALVTLSTAADGRFSIDGLDPSESIDLRPIVVRQDRGLAERWTHAVAPAEYVTIEVVDLVRVSGVVRICPDGPGTYAHVTLDVTDSAGERRTIECRAPEGEYACELRREHHQVHIRVELAHGTTAEKDIEIEPREDERRIRLPDIVADRLEKINVHVVDTADRPIERASLTTEIGHARPAWLTDAEGNATIYILAQGSVTARRIGGTSWRSSGPVRSPLTVTMPDGPVTEVTIAAKSGDAERLRRVLISIEDPEHNCTADFCARTFVKRGPADTPAVFAYAVYDAARAAAWPLEGDEGVQFFGLAAGRPIRIRVREASETEAFLDRTVTLFPGGHDVIEF